MSLDTSTLTLTEDMAYKRRKAEEIQRLEERLDEYKLPKNVAIIGPPRVGKSSFINSVIASFSFKCWRERTRVGSFDRVGEQVTHHLIKITKDEYLDSEEQKVYPYPTLIDMDGFDDESSDKIKEQLRYVLFGVVPHEHKIQDTIRINIYNGAKGVREAYNHTQEPLKVDCLIFVASSDSALPYNLIEAVKQVESSEKRVIPVFGVLTKKDKCNPEEIYSKKKGFRSKLGLSENHFLHCTNYCDDYDKVKRQSRCNRVYPELDVPILKFMRQVCDAGIKVIQDNALPVSSQSSLNFVRVALGLTVVGLVLLAIFIKNR